jgi:hypothetical protein
LTATDLYILHVLIYNIKYNHSAIVKLFKNVVAQFVGRSCLINQAAIKIW